tara:strand:- start:210 stop:443 length:234 start_codon:yes stop_codon:yes gene_type:complete
MKRYTFLLPVHGYGKDKEAAIKNVQWEYFLAESASEFPEPSEVVELSKEDIEELGSKNYICPILPESVENVTEDQEI